MAYDINKIADVIDEVAMAYYEAGVATNPHYSYLEALTSSLASINEQKIVVKGLTPEVQTKIKENLTLFDHLPMDQEALRKALFLLEIKAYKHAHYALDQMMPDGVAIIFTFLINCLNLEHHTAILDLTLRNANLSVVLANYLNGHYHFLGIEANHALCLYDEQKANLLQIHLDIRFQDALKFSYADVGAIVGDLSNYEYQNKYYTSPMYDEGIRDFCYLAIEKHLASGDDDTLGFYLVDADFFSLPNKDLFKKHFEKDGFFKAIITLPPNFFLGEPKLIVVVAKKCSKYQQRTSIFTMPNYVNQEDWQKTLIKIKNDMGE